MACANNIGKQYRAFLVESIKTAGQMIIEMAEDIAGKTDYMSSLSMSIDFDPEMGNVPELTIHRSHVPDVEKLDHLLDYKFDIRKNLEGEKSNEH